MGSMRNKKKYHQVHLELCINSVDKNVSHFVLFPSPGMFPLEPERTEMESMQRRVSHAGISLSFDLSSHSKQR